MIQPVHILTSPRSFSSVVNAMIGQHPELYGVPELSIYIGDSIGEVLRNTVDPAFLQGTVRAISEIAYGSQSLAASLEGWRFLLNNQTMTPKTFMDFLHQQLNGRRIVEKSPIYAYNKANLARMPKGAHYIHLVRHPATYFESLREYHALQQFLPKDGKTDYIYESWVQNQQNIEEFLKDIPAERKMVIQGENVLLNPKIVMREVAEFLGVSTDDTAIDAMLHPEKSPYSFIGNMYAKYGNDAFFLNDPVLRPAEVKPASLEGLPDDVVKLAHKYGYV